MPFFKLTTSSRQGSGSSVVDALNMQEERGLAMAAQTLLGLSGSYTTPAGYAASAEIQFDKTGIDRAMLAKLAQELLRDPLAMQQLSDRVYALMQADVSIQQERSRSYGGRF